MSVTAEFNDDSGAPKKNIEIFAPRVGLIYSRSHNGIEKEIVEILNPK